MAPVVEMLSERLESKKEKKKPDTQETRVSWYRKVGAKEAVDSKKMRAVGCLGVLFCSRLDQTKEGNPKKEAPRAKGEESAQQQRRDSRGRREGRTMRAPDAGLELDCIARYKSQEGLSGSGRRGWYMRAPLFTRPRLLICSAPGKWGGALESLRQDGPAEEASSGLACIRSCSCGARIGTSSTSSTSSRRVHWHNVEAAGRRLHRTGGKRFSTTAEQGPDRERLEVPDDVDNRPMVAAACRTPAPPRALPSAEERKAAQDWLHVCACGTDEHVQLFSMRFIFDFRTSTKSTVCEYSFSTDAGS
jgi:hypothetical protein